MARFVLIHGAWHGGWCFQPLAAELERRGHTAVAPDLPCEDVGLSPRDYAAIVGRQPDSIVLGHSLGGITIPLIEARVHVFLSALLPVENVYAEALRPEFSGTERDELGRSFWPDFDTAAARLYPDLDRDTATRAFERLRRQAPLGVEPLPAPSRSAYLVTGRDAALSPDWQRRAAREFLGVEPIELDAGHSAWSTHVAEIASALISVA